MTRSVFRRLATSLAAVTALSAVAYLPPVEERCGVKVEIGSFPQKIERPGKNRFAWPFGVTEVQAGAPRSFPVTLENKTDKPVAGELEVWMNDDWDVAGRQGALTLAPGEKKELSYTGTARPRALNALYPVHARFTPAGAKKEEAPHPIAFFCSNYLVSNSDTSPSDGAEYRVFVLEEGREPQLVCSQIVKDILKRNIEMVNGGYYTDTPHLRVVIDRAKCELMKVPMSSIYTVLQHNLGSVYVNDVNLGTQVNRVTVMADWSGRARPDDVKSLYVRSKTGAMVPLDALVTCHEELGPRACYRCDQYMYCSEQFIPKPGVSMSEAIEEILAICRDKLSPGFVNDWSGVTYEALKSRGDEGLLACLSLLLAYLALVVCKETWRGAFRAMLPSVAAVFGAMLALSVSGVSFAVCSQFALALLVATTAAMSLFSESSASIAWRLFMPLLAAMAALPLVFSSGAGSVGSRSLGVTLLGGYVAYAAIAAVRQWAAACGGFSATGWRRLGGRCGSPAKVGRCVCASAWYHSI